MAKIPQRSLFNWNAIEAKSDLERFYLVRDNLPDEPIAIALEKNRGNGRCYVSVPAISLATRSMSRRLQQFPPIFPIV